MNQSLHTDFAPAPYATEDDLARQISEIEAIRSLRQLYDAVDDCILILNSCRQIIFANAATLKLLQLERREQIYGKRPGDVVDCMYASESEGGCGTTTHCSQCGAVLSILTSQQTNEKSVLDCHILNRNGDAITLRVASSPLVIGDESATIMVLQDVSDVHRRRSLERIFFHDILNDAGGIRGLSEILPYAEKDEVNELSQLIHMSSNVMVQEIESQRELLSIENGEYETKNEITNVAAVLSSVQSAYIKHPVIRDRHLIVEKGDTTITMNTNPSLLHRVLGNMVKNALEASSEGQTVTLNYEIIDDHIRFAVHNPNVMPNEIKLQIFQRAFSTKGQNRGLGTYSMKLISERYLGGIVSFSSELGEGTVFYAEYPFDKQSITCSAAGKNIPLNHSFAKIYPHEFIIIEDDVISTTIAKRMLGHLGYDQIYGTERPECAVALLADKKCDVILMDVQMPDMDGITLTRAIREKAAIRQPLIVGITAVKAFGFEKQCRDAGMDAFIEKPYTLHQLACAIAGK
ncbi:MAG: response regulator [Spartobacteria bacterium]|nr:response regulator [Spartobacteria bacterium]